MEFSTEKWRNINSAKKRILKMEGTLISESTSLESLIKDEEITNNSDHQKDRFK
jgi:hypothetical protein